MDLASRAPKSCAKSCAQTVGAEILQNRGCCAKCIVFQDKKSLASNLASKLASIAYQTGDPRCSSNHTGCWFVSQTRLLPKTCFFHLPTGAPSLHPGLSHSTCRVLPVAMCMLISACRILHVEFGMSHSACRVLHVAFCITHSACRILHVEFCMSLCAC